MVDPNGDVVQECKTEFIQYRNNEQVCIVSPTFGDKIII